MRSIILLAFKFPPYDQVGSYRWTKFCKYLSELGHQIDVITVDWAITDKGQKGLQEVLSDKIIIHRIPSGYPHKLKYRKLKSKYLRYLRLAFFRVLDRVLFFDDEAQRWGKYAIPYVEKLLANHQNPVLIATGAPFQTNLIAAKLKHRNPGLRLIQDMRDIWASNIHKLVTSTQRREIERWQQNVITSSDRVVGVSQTLLDDMKVAKGAGVVIENGYDEAFKSGEWAPSSGDRISLIHIGSISNGRDIPLEALLRTIRDRDSLVDKFVIKLIGNIGPRRKAVLKGIGGELLTFVESMEQEEAFQELLKADYALQLSSPDYPYALSTKIYEYGMLKVPTLSLNYGSEIEDFMKRADLGISINLKSDELGKKLEELDFSEVGTFKCEVEEFSHSKLAKKYSDLINSL